MLYKMILHAEFMKEVYMKKSVSQCGIKAFTLAEVLITLAIIGIVAALTIPSVISNYQQQEYKTGLKKAVSVLNEAIQMNISQDGETPYENQDLFKYLQRHMSVLKSGELNFCYNKETNAGVETNYCGSDGYNENKVFYTTDGMRFEIIGNIRDSRKHYYLYETGLDINASKGGPYKYSVSSYCGSYGLSNNLNNTTNPPCIIMVDVNGDKKPNPPKTYDEGTVTYESWYGSPSNPTYYTASAPANQPFTYVYPSPYDKKLQDVFTIMITDEKAIPFGVVAQRAMYSK